MHRLHFHHHHHHPSRRLLQSHRYQQEVLAEEIIYPALWSQQFVWQEARVICQKWCCNRRNKGGEWQCRWAERPNELNEPNEANNQPRRYYMNTIVTIANQELELPSSNSSHAVISRSSWLMESDKLGRKLKARIMKAKQYHSSHLGRRYCNSAQHIWQSRYFWW